MVKKSRMNNKGFSLVEMLGVIVILGILSGIAVIAVTGSLDNSKEQSYEVMEKSVYNAAQNYVLDSIDKFSGNKTVRIEKLVEDGYLEPLIDPAKKDGSECSGTVVIESKGTTSSGGLDELTYTVKLVCSMYVSGGFVSGNAGEPVGVVYPKG